MGKMYVCADCTGAGKVPCPVCRPNIETKHPRTIQLKEIELRFGQA
jgi:hypothetical protein